MSAHVAVVGDRGMLTRARIKTTCGSRSWTGSPRCAARPSGADQPGRDSAHPVRPGRHGRDTSPGYPGERLTACYNPFLEAERARKRGELLAAEAELEKIAAATRRARRPPRGKDNIALAVGKVINKKRSPSTASSRSPRTASPGGG